MGNIKNFNFNKLDLKLSNSDYWDFFLATDEYNTCGMPLNENCSVVWYDFNNPQTYENESFSANSIYSLVTWDKAVNTGYTFNTVGITGIDNGLIIFEKDPLDFSNLALLSALTGTTLIIPSGDTRLHMTRVTGTTGNFIYPIDFISGETSYAQFCGGFYQGYYKIDGSSYEVLPTRVPSAWSAEFWLNPQDICSYTGLTLNDVYPNNKGFFFYMGTRAENKFWNQFYGADTGCTYDCTQPSGCTDIVSQFCTIPKEIDISLVGDYGVAIPLDPPQVSIEIITNQFLIYGRARNDAPNRLTGNTGTFIFNDEDLVNLDSSGNCNTCSVCGDNHDGLGCYTVCTYDKKGIVIAKTAEVLSNFDNPFLIYGRASNSTGCTCTSCSGPNDGFGNQTVCSFSGMSSPDTELDYNIDIIDNALGLRIKDDGSIGYRLLTLTGSCYTASTGQRLYHSGITMQEGYSISGVVSSNAWSYIAVRFIMPYLNECDLKIKPSRKGKIMFYINGKLKYVAENIPENIGRRLNEHYLKQVGVPFNFSLGGGSQGLLESQTFDGLDMSDRNLPIESNFAGTFIGGIQQFKFNICDLTYSEIQENYALGLSGMTQTLTKAPSRYYYGKLSGTTLTINDVNNLNFTLGNQIINNYITFTSITNSYGYVLVPIDFQQPTNFKNSQIGCQGFTIPYIQLPNINILDENGFNIEYLVYRTYNKTSGILDIWFCD